MKLYKDFTGDHSDFIHDVRYDFYGKRLATCSSDHTVKVWSENGQGEWKCSGVLNGHRGPVWKLAWAHPEFGTMLASCSYDHTVLIWEEQSEGRLNTGNTDTSQGSWHQCGSLAHNEMNDSIADVEFSPPRWGLRLATCGADGIVRIWTPNDMMNLAKWTSKNQFESDTKPLTSLSWCPCKFDIPMMAVGSSTGSVKIWGYFSVGGWKSMNELVGHEQTVNDVCWAPSMGRAYHLVASVSSDKHIKIWKLQKHSSDTSKWNTTLVADLVDDTEVWRAEWNVTGTVLATSNDDGAVSLWRKNLSGEWTKISSMSAASK